MQSTVLLSLRQRLSAMVHRRATTRPIVNAPLQQQHGLVSPAARDDQ